MLILAERPRQLGAAFVDRSWHHVPRGIGDLIVNDLRDIQGIGGPRPEVDGEIPKEGIQPLFLGSDYIGTL